MRSRGPALLILALLQLGCGPRSSPPPWQGEQQVVVALLSWSDRDPEVTRDEVEAAFFDPGGDSLRTWFDENSAGALQWRGTVLHWRELDEPWGDREPCEVQPLAELLWDAVAGDVDRRAHDADGNRRIDHLLLLHDGRSDHHRISWRCMFAELRVADRVAVMEAQGLGPLGASVPIGLYAHEAGHAFFGFEDLYGARYRGRYGIGIWGPTRCPRSTRTSVTPPIRSPAARGSPATRRRRTACCWRTSPSPRTAGSRSTWC